MYVCVCVFSVLLVLQMYSKLASLLLLVWFTCDFVSLLSFTSYVTFHLDVYARKVAYFASNLVKRIFLGISVEAELKMIFSLLLHTFLGTAETIRTLSPIA